MPTKPESSRVEAHLPTVENSYVYEPLPQGYIRFIILHPGEPSDPVDIEILPFDLNNDRAGVLQWLEALSYMWGIPTPSRTINCLGTDRGRLSVTPNLYDALSSLRWKKNSRLLWVDQICINQSDNLEKSPQVQMMGEIYSKAKRVVVWLSKEAFYCKELATHLSQMLQLYYDLGGYQYFIETPFISDVKPGSLWQVTDECWAATILIFSSPYFTRIWMIQEVAMGKEVFVAVEGGGIDWSWIEIIGIMLSHPGPLGDLPVPLEMKKNLTCLTKMQTLRARIQAAPQEWPRPDRWCLLDLVQQGWSFQATEPRDKVYALLGLLSFKDHCIPQDLYPDYSSATTYQQLVHQVTITAFTKEGCLESLIKCSPRRNVKSPSWLLDVQDPRSNNVPNQLAMDLYKFSASDGAAAHVRTVPNDEMSLWFKITLIGAVEKLASIAVWKQNELWEMGGERKYNARFPFSTDDVYEIIHSSFQVVLPPETEGIISENHDISNIFMDFCKAFLCGFSFETIAIDQGKRTPETIGPHEISVFKQVLSGKIDLEKASLRSGFNLMAPAFVRTYGMRFFQATPEFNSTHNSQPDPPLIGWIPKEAVVGDILAIIHGFHFPMLLRKIAVPEERYKFLGISYIHGFMEGQVFQEKRFQVKDIMIA